MKDQGYAINQKLTWNFRIQVHNRFILITTSYTIHLSPLTETIQIRHLSAWTTTGSAATSNALQKSKSGCEVYAPPCTGPKWSAKWSTQGQNGRFDRSFSWNRWRNGLEPRQRATESDSDCVWRQSDQQRLVKDGHLDRWLPTRVCASVFSFVSWIIFYFFFKVNSMWYCWFAGFRSLESGVVSQGRGSLPLLENGSGCRYESTGNRRPRWDGVQPEQQIWS